MLDLKFDFGKGLQKKAIALSLTVCMVFGGMYVNAKAQDTTDEMQSVEDDYDLEQSPETGTPTEQTPEEALTIPVESISLDYSKKVLLIRKTLQLTETILPEDATNQEVEWVSSNDEIATVSEEGLVTARSGGSATITAISEDDETVTAVCKIVVPQVTMNTSNVVLQVGTTTSAVKIASFYPTTDKVAGYKSSNTKTVKVDSTGKLSAIKTGSAKITITMKSGAMATYNVTVQKKAVVTKSLKLSADKLTLKAGATKKLVVARNPITAEDALTWTSSNESIATVDANGKVTAVSAGKATITAKANGKKATCKVTVPATIKLKDASAKLKVGGTAKIEIKSKTLASDKVESYKTDSKTVATVNKNGVVKAIAKGKAIITITMKSGATATYTVTVK